MTSASPPGPPSGQAQPGLRRWLRALGVVMLCTAIAELMAPHSDLANLIMVYLAGVVFVALHEGARVAAASVVLSIFLFNLLHVPPRWGLNPLNPSHFLTFGVMLAVGLLISQLATWARRQTELAEGRARRAQALSGLAEALTLARTPEAIADCVSRAVQSSFGAPAALRAGPADGDAAPWAVPLEASGQAWGQLMVQVAPNRPMGRGDAELLAAFGHQAVLALERAALEERTARALVEAEAERLRNTLLSGISHDVRTPLTTIVGAATTLVEQELQLDAEGRTRLIHAILGEARRLHGLVSDLLDLTRLEEGAMPLNLEWCPADDLVAESLAMIGARLQTHDVRTEVPSDAIVWCDARLIGQALVNMTDNALRYTPPGTRVTLRVLVQPGSCRIEVADAGPGLPPDGLQEVFRKFQRGRREPAGSGFGLGLAICAAVARVHGGTISARNAEGACFTLVLPQPAVSRRVGEEAE